MQRILLADVGGTHVRFAISYDGSVELIRKYYVSEFPDLIQATERYLREVERSTYSFDLYALSSAAVFDEGVWKFTNHNPWIIDPDKVCRALPIERFTIIDDFQSNAYGVLAASEDDLHVIRPASQDHDPKLVRCIARCGTGLGLSYLIPVEDRIRVHETWGGHMVPAAITQEQRDMLDAVQKVKMVDSSPIFEDVVSGPGFSRIYHILKQEETGKEAYFSANDILRKASEGGEIATHALRLFHEFLGLFVHQAVVYNHAYGSVHLTGGMIDVLFRLDLFDTETFLEYFHMRPVPVVDKSLRSVPIYWVKDEYVALRGLIKAHEMGGLSE